MKLLLKSLLLVALIAVGFGNAQASTTKGGGDLAPVADPAINHSKVALPSKSPITEIDPPEFLVVKSAPTTQTIVLPPVVEEEPETSKAPLPPPTGTSLVNNVFFETDLREALQDIASQTGRMIIAGGEVMGYVTCELKDATFEKALALVLAGTGYLVEKREDYIFVCSPNPTGRGFSDIALTRVVRLNYVNPTSAVKLLSESFQAYVKAASPGGDTTKGSAMSNVVCITAPSSILERIVSDLKLIDAAPQQVILDARIVVMEEGDLMNLGMQWGWPTVQAGAFTNYQRHGGLGEDNIPLQPQWPWGVEVGYTPGQEFTNALMLTMNLLATNDELNVLSSPQVMAQDGAEAQISVIAEEYFEILSQGYYTQSKLEKIESGTVLKVTPRILDNGEISLEMDVEVSGVLARGESNLPVVTRRTAHTVVRVEDGGTAAVAGLMDNRTRQNNEKVPFLGQIPLLGYLFRNKSSLESTRQVAVFLTARIVGGDAPETKISVPAPTCSPTPLVSEKAFRTALADILNGTEEPGE